MQVCILVHLECGGDLQAFLWNIVFYIIRTYETEQLYLYRTLDENLLCTVLTIFSAIFEVTLFVIYHRFVALQHRSGACISIWRNWIWRTLGSDFEILSRKRRCKSVFLCEFNFSNPISTVRTYRTIFKTKKVNRLLFST